MMKLKIFLILVFLCFCGCLFSYDNQLDDLMWAEAYKGNFSIVHKLMLSRRADCIGDDMMNQFIMAYVYYRMGHLEKIDVLFKGVDNYFERVVVQNVK
jgi:hypothetical protein